MSAPPAWKRKRKEKETSPKISVSVCTHTFASPDHSRRPEFSNTRVLTDPDARARPPLVGLPRETLYAYRLPDSVPNCKGIDRRISSRFFYSTRKQ